jgi:hypothetical protein
LWRGREAKTRRQGDCRCAGPTPKSSGGPAANISGWRVGQEERRIGSAGCAARNRYFSLTGSSIAGTAEHREPNESRGQWTVVEAPGLKFPRTSRLSPSARRFIPLGDIRATLQRDLATCLAHIAFKSAAVITGHRRRPSARVRTMAFCLRLSGSSVRLTSGNSPLTACRVHAWRHPENAPEIKPPPRTLTDTRLGEFGDHRCQRRKIRINRGGMLFLRPA